MIEEDSHSGVEDPRLIPPLQQLGELLLKHPGKCGGTSHQSQKDLDIDLGLEYLERALNITQGKYVKVKNYLI